MVVTRMSGPWAPVSAANIGDAPARSLLGATRRTLVRCAYPRAAGATSSMNATALRCEGLASRPRNPSARLRAAHAPAFEPAGARRPGPRDRRPGRRHRDAGRRARGVRRAVRRLLPDPVAARLRDDLPGQP